MTELKLGIAKGKVKLINENNGESKTIINFYDKNNFTVISSDTLYKEFAETINNYDKIKKYTYSENKILDMTVLAGLMFKKLMKGKYRNIKALEIGSGFGCTSYFLANSLKTFSKSNHLYCFDSWESDPDNNSNNIAKYENIFEHFRSVMEYAEVYEQIIPVICDVKTGTKVLQNNFFDIIFINGNHGYNSVYNDIINSIKKIKCGGLVIGNNCECYADELPAYFFQEDNKNIDLVEGYHCGIIKALNDIWGRNYELFENGLLWYKKVQKEDKNMFQDKDSYQYITKIETIKGLIKNLSKKLNYIYSNNINEEKSDKFRKKLNEAILKISRVENMLLPIYDELQNSELKIMTNQLKCLLIKTKINFDNNQLHKVGKLINKLMKHFEKWKIKVKKLEFYFQEGNLR